MKTQTKPSRVIGPEDVRRGDYVTVTHTMYEYISDLCPSITEEEVKIVRVTVMSDDAGLANKVVAVCLPFILVEDTTGKRESLDLRRHRIAILTKNYGRKAFKKKKPLKKQPTKT